jgi:hypothetical protein
MKLCHLAFWWIICCGSENASANAISGMVTLDGSGLPVTSGSVRIHNAGGVLLGSAFLQSNGTYSYGGLAPGTYYARTNGTGFFDELWSDIPCAQGNCIITLGTPINVSAAPATANFALIPGGSIMGTVTVDGTSAPIGSGSVRIHSASGVLLGSAFLSSNGSYSYGGLAPGTYYARTNATGYFDELWNNIPCAHGNCTVNSGTPIIVGGNPVTANFALVPGGSIIGTVTVEGSGTPISDGSVRIHNGSGTLLGSAFLNANGTFAYGGLAPGTYFARTNGTGYSDELWNNMPCPSGNCVINSGTPIVVTSAAVAIDFTLGAGGAVAGTVVAEGSGVPINTGSIRIHNAGGTLLGSAFLSKSGSYSYTGLAPGTYYARTNGTGYFDELWNNIPCAQGNCTVTSGTPIIVSATPVVADFALVTGGSIIGTVTVEGSGLPVTNGSVRIHNAGGSLVGSAFLQNNGAFSYGGLASGTYYARTNGTGLVDELWNNIPCAQGSCTVTTGTPIGVPVSGHAIANFQLGGSDLIFSDGFQ